MVGAQRWLVTVRALTHRFVAARKLHAPLAACEGGQSTAEFALIVPVLLLVVFGIIKFGALYNNYIQLTNAADAGARLFSIERGQATPCSDVQSQVDSTAATLASSNITLSLSSVTQNAPTTTSNWSTSPTGQTCPWTTSDGLVSGNTATVSASYPWDLSFLGLKIVSSTMSVSATEQVE